MSHETEQPDAQSAPQSDSPPITPPKTGLLATDEGRVLLLGLSIIFIYTIWLAAQLLFAPDRAQLFIGMTATGLLFGRAAAMAFGYSLGLTHASVIPIAMVIETVMVLIIYPLFVLSVRKLVVLGPLRNFFLRIRQAAEAHKPTVQKYGIVGLFAFVWLPFWMTGPVVGSIIGFLLGLRTWITILAVLAGTYVAIFCWAILLRQIHRHIAGYSSYAAMFLMLLIVLVIVIANLLHRTTRKNNHHS